MAPRTWPVFLHWLLAVVGGQLLGGVLLLGWAVVFAARHPGTGPDALSQALKETLMSPGGLLLLLGTSSCVLALSSWLLGRRAPGGYRAGLMLYPKRMSLLTCVLAAAGALATTQLGSNIRALFTFTGKSDLDAYYHHMVRGSSGWVGPALLIMFMAAGLGEELFFRGYMQTRLRQRFGPLAAICIPAILFAVSHGEPIYMLMVLPLGLFLGWATERTGTVVPALLAHGSNNLAAAALMFTAGAHSKELASRNDLALCGLSGIVLAGCILGLRRQRAPDTKD